MQNDESIFATVVYAPIAREFRLRAFGHDVPLMIMTYLGAFKSWVYALLFAFCKPTVWSLRLPMVLIGTVTIGLFSVLCTKASKRSITALLGAILLASDPSFLLTTVYDWGPVAFQHLFLVSGALQLLYFAHSQRNIALAGGFFCLGLGMWDKALMSWSLFGLGLATLIVFFPELRRLLRPRTAGIAVLAFVVGGAPLVLYNIRQNLKTFRSNAKLDLSRLGPKWHHVKSTMDGSALFGYLVREEWEERKIAPDTAVARASLTIRETAGERRYGYGYWAFLAALAAIPLWWKRYRRAVLFTVLFLAASWALMAATHEAGETAHHVVLLWPFPQFLIAIVLTALAERGRSWMVLAGICTGLVAGQNLLVVNQYYTQATRVCGGQAWSDAVHPLHEKLVQMRAGLTSINLLGWGTEFTLTMLEKGALPLRNAAVHVGEETPAPHDREAIQAILGETSAIFVAYVPDVEIQPGMAKRFETAAASLGYRKEMIETISDRCGRPTFEIFRFVSVTVPPPR
jgi:hypothetical protein